MRERYVEGHVALFGNNAQGDLVYHNSNKSLFASAVEAERIQEGVKGK